MFCPLCRSEYREGFTRCSDCGVELVHAILDRSTEDSAGAHSEDNTLVLLWRGEDPTVRGAIASALNQARIHWREALPQNHRAPLMIGLPSDFQAKFGFEIRVSASELEAARQILEAVLDQEPEELSIQAAEEQDALAEAVEPELPKDWSPEKATVEIWKCEDQASVEFLADTLRENGIGSRSEGRSPEPLHLFVCPADESRAREILREITEGTPPA